MVCRVSHDGCYGHIVVFECPEVSTVVVRFFVDVFACQPEVFASSWTAARFELLYPAAVCRSSWFDALYLCCKRKVDVKISSESHVVLHCEACDMLTHGYGV